MEYFSIINNFNNNNNNDYYKINFLCVKYI